MAGAIARAVNLLLPAIIPSWNFFDVITPSPRIEYRLIGVTTANDWIEFRPRPKGLSLAQRLTRLVWNPSWNETLFTVSLSERVMQDDGAFAEDLLFNRIHNDLPASVLLNANALQFRLVTVYRAGKHLEREEVYRSTERPLEEVQGA